METDRPLKVLFERQGQSLLPFIGEHRTGVRVAAVECVELPILKRTIDSVLRLEQDGHVWYRHVEFQAQKDTGLPRRCFEYNSRLILHYAAAVLTNRADLVEAPSTSSRSGRRRLLSSSGRWRKRTGGQRRVTRQSPARSDLHCPFAGVAFGPWRAGAGSGHS